MNLVEFIQAGGTVRLVGQPLEERLTPRQLRFLFATGAFKAGKAAARATQAGIGKAEGRLVPSGMARFRPGGLFKDMAGRGAIRGAAKQAMAQQLKSYKGMKARELTVQRLIKHTGGGSYWLSASEAAAHRANVRFRARRGQLAR